MANITFTLNNVTTIHDETDGLQNNPPNLDATIDTNGNDIDISALPTLFSNRLGGLGTQSNYRDRSSLEWL